MLALVAMFVTLVAMSVSLEVIFEALAAIFVTLVAMSVTFVAISVSLELIADALVAMFVTLVAMSVSLELILDVFVLMLDSTSESEPRVKVPSISASLRIVTVPEVWPSDRSPVEKSPYRRFLSSVSTQLPSPSRTGKPVEMYSLFEPVSP